MKERALQPKVRCDQEFGGPGTQTRQLGSSLQALGNEQGPSVWMTTEKKLLHVPPLTRAVQPQPVGRGVPPQRTWVQ